MRTNILYLILCQCLLINVAVGEELEQEVQVTDAYIEIRTGADTRYPIFHVVERGQKIVILSRKTNWFKVKTLDGKQGWVDRSQLEQTLTAQGANFQIKDATVDDFSRRRWEMGMLGGSFNESSAMTVYGAYAFNPTLSTELSLTKVIDDFSASVLINVNILSQPFPNWRVSPFFTIGVGVLDIKPRKTLVQSQDNNDQINHFGIGLRRHLTRRLLLRVEYRNYIAFSSRDDNKEYDEWKAGFSAFF